MNHLHYLLMYNEPEPASGPPSHSLTAGLHLTPSLPLPDTVSRHAYCARELFRARDIQQPCDIDVIGQDPFITVCRWTGSEAGMTVS